MLNNAKQFIVDNWGKWKAIWIESDRIEDCMEYYVKNNLNVIAISPYKGFLYNDLSFLDKYPYIEGIFITSASRIDISKIMSLTQLKYITIADNKQVYDFSSFSQLEALRITYSPKAVFPQVSTIKELYLRNYTPKSKSFLELPSYPYLENLELIHSTIKTLDEIGKYKNLQELHLSSLPKLENIADIKALKNVLLWLELDNCKKIKDIDDISHLKNLEKLQLSACGNIPSISFIKELSRLKFFSFVNTEVVDGNLTTCLEASNLEYVGFSDKKHYSHKLAELRNLITELRSCKGCKGTTA